MRASNFIFVLTVSLTTTSFVINSTAHAGLFSIFKKKNKKKKLAKKALKRCQVGQANKMLKNYSSASSTEQTSYIQQLIEADNCCNREISLAYGDQAPAAGGVVNSPAPPTAVAAGTSVVDGVTIVSSASPTNAAALNTSNTFANILKGRESKVGKYIAKGCKGIFTFHDGKLSSGNASELSYLNTIDRFNSQMSGSTATSSSPVGGQQ